MSDVETELEALLVTHGAKLPLGRNTQLCNLALDSLRQLELIVAIENRFRIVLTADDELDLATLADLARLIAARRVETHRG